MKRFSNRDKTWQWRPFILPSHNAFSGFLPTVKGRGPQNMAKRDGIKRVNLQKAKLIGSVRKADTNLAVLARPRLL